MNEAEIKINERKVNEIGKIYDWTIYDLGLGCSIYS